MWTVLLSFVVDLKDGVVQRSNEQLAILYLSSIKAFHVSVDLMCPREHLGSIGACCGGGMFADHHHPPVLKVTTNTRV